MWRAARTRGASLAPTGSEGRHHADHDRLLRLGSTQDRRSVEVDLARREAQSSGVHGLTTAPQAQGAWGGHPLQAPAPSRRTSSPWTSLSVRAAAAGGGSWRCTRGASACGPRSSGWGYRQAALQVLVPSTSLVGDPPPEFWQLLVTNRVPPSISIASHDSWHARRRPKPKLFRALNRRRISCLQPMVSQSGAKKVY